jgi:lipopolysaccharide export system permease protein
MIIRRYLLREILGSFALMLTVLCVLFMGYGAAGFLSDAANGLLPTSMIVQVIGLQTLIALETLIPISLYLSVVMALGRLYADSEMTALFALGWTSARMMSVVVGLSLCTAVIVAGLSLVARPWAYTRSHELASVAQASLNSNNMQAGTFYVTGKGERTIYIERREGPAAPAGGVFVQLRLRGGGTRIISAASIEQLSPVLGGPRFHLSGAHVYDIDVDGSASEVGLNANDLNLQLVSPSVHAPDYSAIAASTTHLRSSDSAPDIAEFQWRESTSVTTLLLGLLAVPLSRAQPRGHRNTQVGIALLIYAGYYLLYESARTWVQIGVLPPFPGLWIAPASLALVLIVALQGPKLGPRWRGHHDPT